MAKTKKRTVTCGSCKKTGHNARTCPSKDSAVVKNDPVAEETAAPIVENKTDLEEARRESKVPRREAPTADIGSANAPSFRCPKCSQVGILVIVRVKDSAASARQSKDVFTGETRCEKCMNKPTPSDLILKWGALPNEQVAV